ncbi:hypothetical protein ACFL27_04420 [candidate division CSSED10-310 bacterium]|uniref:Secreted protein n=1 Tax=candidate division CSSED10-310 bacterium TaxID=2855610 RepID=A0ABV6YTM3_UNCC1
MKRYATVLVLTLVLVVSASIALAQSLYCPYWLDDAAASWSSMIFVYNTDSTDHTVTLTLRKWFNAATKTTHVLTIAAKDILVLDMSTYTGFIPSASPFRGSAEMYAGAYGNGTPVIIGFTFRYITGTYDTIYTEPLFAIPIP